mmetsp:Transcript_47473/g.125910  ORF Transcript_47473/g.125910 Transcript_47473/m.125910 type:complete len:141 (+) Transcript_47473:547-969(+)
MRNSVSEATHKGVDRQPVGPRLDVIHTQDGKTTPDRAPSTTVARLSVSGCELSTGRVTWVPVLAGVAWLTVDANSVAKLIQRGSNATCSECSHTRHLRPRSASGPNTPAGGNNMYCNGGSSSDIPGEANEHATDRTASSG